MTFRLLKAIKPFTVLSLIALTGCATINADLEAGKAARREGNYEKAIQNLQPLADFGMPDAKYELALALLGQEDVTPEETQQAQQLLAQLADTGHAPATFELARQYDHAKMPQKAKDYYQRAADLGYARGYFQLGNMAEKEKNFPAAEGLYKQAFDGQYYKAAERIGRLYEKGMGRPVDLNQALSWYKRAQQMGVTDLETKIGELEAGVSNQ